MDYLEERLALSAERINEITQNQEVLTDFKDYFKRTAVYINMAVADYLLINKKNSAKELIDIKKINKALYEDILGDNYKNSYANPKYAVEMTGEYGAYFSYLLAEIYSLPAYIFEGKLFNVVILLELFLEVYGLFEGEQKPAIKSVEEALYYYAYDYSEELVSERVRETLTTENSFAKDIVINSDFSDLDYLYLYGEYISDNEIKLAEFLNKMSQNEIDAMARTFTEGFKRGFSTMRIDLAPKKTVNIRYSIGQERIVRAAIKQFENMGLSTILNRYAVSRVNRKLTIRQGYTATPANKQFDYDHRMDDSVFLDKAFMDRKLNVTKQAYEELKEAAACYAGPAVIEVFGEKNFSPEICESALKYSDKQQELSVELASKAGQIVNEYIPGDKYSFTIIAYPMPEIGDNFEDIFRETVKVNNLDNDKFTRIQQTIIDTLDTADYARVVGCGDNKTDMKVMLHKLKNPEAETKFENCVADVNIPVGEVFTSPILTGTKGTLNVSQVYLNGLSFKNLKLNFMDGKITDYTCDNFNDEQDNKSYIKENILFGRETLPIGEFAIGTNTTAYVMAEKFNITDKLPILIVEKMGPHFAVGDTCYSHSEDHAVYNQNGKEIISRENECSMLRNSDMSQAYFNCHTDITIPYDEIGGIYAVKPNGTEVAIILDGRFVLKGTEELNDVF